MSEWQHEIRQRLARLSLRPEREVEIVDELSQHLDEFVRERVAGGTPEDVARRDALADLDLPGELARRLASTEVSQPLNLPPPGAPARGQWLSQVWQDVRLALRALRRRPGFSAAVLVTVALTIGPTTAIVSVGNWLLWTPSPAVTQPDRLVVIWSAVWTDEGGARISAISYPNLDDLRNSSRTLTDLAGWQEPIVSMSVGAPGLKPRPGSGAFVTAEFFDVLGVRLAAGRPFRRDEDTPPHGGQVVVISQALAEQAFGVVEDAPGQEVHVNGRPMTVVGVAPRDFGGMTPTSRIDVWCPGASYTFVNHSGESAAQMFAGRSIGLFHTFVGRLAPGESGASAQAELDTLIPLFAERHPRENRQFQEARARVFQRLGPQELQRPRLKRLVEGLLIVAGVLLLLGCANVANLLLSHGVRQQHERGVRLALGANRGRLIRQLLTETVVLSLSGAVLGVGLAVWLKQLIQVLMLPQLSTFPVPVVVPIDSWVLSVTLLAAVTCGLAAGIVPALLGTSSLQRVLSRDGGRAGTRRSGVRATFAALQLALSLALVTGALLMVATMRNYADVTLGFDPEGVATQRLNLDRHGYTPERSQIYHRELLARLTADPAIEAVSLSTGFPFGYNVRRRLQTPGGSEGQTTSVYAVATTERFPHVLGLQVIRGRYFHADEVMIPTRAPGGPVVVSESLARAFFGEAEAVGQHVTTPPMMGSPGRDFVVVGVVADTLTRSLTGDPDLVLYEPFALDDFRQQTVVMTKARVPIDQVHEVVERAAFELDAGIPVAAAEPIRQFIERGVATVSAFAWVLSLLSVIGFVLAAVGLYGLLSQAVGERTREFGVRLAIGASNRHIAGLVIRQAAWTSVTGTIAGLGLAYWGSGLLKSYLFGVSAFDPRVYAASAAVLVGVVLIAVIRPAWAATRVNPIETLRAE